MRTKAFVSTLLAVLFVAVAVVPTTDAQRRRRRNRQPPPPAAAPQSAAIAPALGDLRWGMEPREVHEHFRAQIEARYAERLRTARDAILEDRIRAEMNSEIRRLRESYIRFTGQHTGWDASFLRGEFTHENQESMLSYRDGDSQNFFFFIRGRLWKWYKAFDSSVFQGQSFADFRGAIEQRFGEGVHRHESLVEGGDAHDWMEWQDATTRLRAVDQTRFYGFFCLVFDEKATIDRLSELRTNRPAAENRNSVIDSIMLPDGEEDDGRDEHSDIVDRITGRNRGSSSSGSGSSGSSGSSSNDEDDPTGAASTSATSEGQPPGAVAGLRPGGKLTAP